MSDRSVTVVFTDVEGSTDLSATAGEEVAQETLRLHERIVRSRTAEHGGREVKALGDGFLLAFGSARDALASALEIQRDVEDRQGGDTPVRVRIGAHTGPVTERDDDLFGATVNAAARITAHARGGQVLVSEDVLREVADVDETSVVDRGLFWLKGFPERWRLFEVRARDAAPAADARPAGGATALVGREEERADLRRRLEEAAAGRGSLVMIGGEPGVGKTRLASEASVEATARGMLAFIGHCSEAEGAPPFLPVVEIVESALRLVPGPVFRETLGDSGGEMARLVPEIRRRFDDIPPPLELPPEQSLRYLWNSVREFVDRIGRRRPLLLVLDDLHWADESTLHLVEYLAQYLGDMPVLIVGTYRDVELDVARPLARTLEELVRRRRVHRISLRRLDRAHVADMLRALSGQDPPDPLAEVIYSETEGNPFFVEEVFQHLAEEGRILDEHGGWRRDVEIGEVDVPESVRLVLGRRLERLDERSRAVLTAAAVLGRSFPLRAVEEVSDASQDDVLDGLDAAEQAKLVTSSSVPGTATFSFAHELIRQTLLAQLSLIRRQRLHLRAADTLERIHASKLDEHAPEIATHLMEAGPGADPIRMRRFCRLAGERALEAAAFSEAVRHLENALAMEPDDERERADLQWKLGLAKRSLGSWDDALPLWQDALAAFERLGDVEHVGALCADMSLQMAWAARWEECLQIVGRGLAALADRETGDRARLLGLGALVISAAGNHDAAEGMLAQAKEVARRVGSEEVLSYVPIAEAIHNYNYARFDRVAEVGSAGIEELKRRGSVWDAVSVAPWVAFSNAVYVRWEDAQKLGDEFGPLADRLGHVGSQLLFHRYRAFHRLAHDADVEAFERSAREDLELCRRGNLPWDSHSHVWLGIVAMWRGAHDDSIEHFREAVRREPVGAYAGIAPGYLSMGLAYAGAADEAMETFEEARDRLEDPAGPPTLGVVMLYATGAEAAAVAGHGERAVELVAWLDEHLEPQMPLRGWDFTLRERFRAMAFAASGRLDEAERHFRRALQQAVEFPQRVEEPQVQLRYGEMLLERGRPEDVVRAKEMLERAAAGLRAIGMPGHEERARRLLDDPAAAVSSRGSSPG